jgi:tetratricopeptide (TPR) repeat protein
MSPEQAEGRSAILDHRTDIYSLGITLYELLTLCPAFPATDRHTLLRQIANDEPPAPRKLHAAIPADLETILLKATAKDPRDRFASARELAADLRRHLNQQPIQAKRASLIDRTRRWAGRHVAIVAAALCTLLLIAATGVTATVLTLNAYDAESKQRVIADEQRTSAEANLTLAQANLRIASDAIENMMMRVATDRAFISNVHRAEVLIAQAAAFHEKLLAQSDDPQFFVNAASTYRRAMGMHYLTGTIGKAESACRRVSELCAELVELDPTKRSDYLGHLANNEVELARILWATNQFSVAEQPVERAIAIWERLLSDSPGIPWHQNRLAEAVNFAGQLSLREGLINEAEASFARCADIFKELPVEAREDYEAYETPRLQGVLLNGQALLARQHGDFDRAIELLHQAIAAQRRAVALENRDHWVHQFSFQHQRDLAETLLLAGRHQDAALAADELAEAFGGSLRTYLESAELVLRCAKLAGVDHSAETYRQRARQLLEKLDGLHTFDLVATDRFAWFLLTCDDSAFRDLPQALRIAQIVTKAAPERLSAWRTLSYAHYRLGQMDEAERALDYSHSHAGDHSADAAELFLRSMIEWRQGDYEGARESFDQARSSMPPPGKTNPNTTHLAAEAAELLKVKR